MIQELNLDKEYDRFIITRSDYLYNEFHPPIDLLSPEYVWIPEGEDWRGYCDRHWVLSKQHLKSCLNLLEPIFCQTDILFNLMKHKSDWNSESYIKLIFDMNNIEVKRFPRTQFLIRASTQSRTWTKGIYDENLQVTIAYPTEYESVKFNFKRFKSLKKWHDYFKKNMTVYTNTKIIKNILKEYPLSHLKFNRIIYTVIIDTGFDEHAEFQKDVERLISDENLIKLSKKNKIIVFNNIKNDMVGDIEFIKIDLLDDVKKWRRTQRIYKILGPILMPNIEYSFYFDVRRWNGFRDDADIVFEELCTKNDSSLDWIQIFHKTAVNYEHEYKRVAYFKKSEELDIVKKEVDRYKKMKIPLTMPMYYGAFIFRKHSSNSVKNLCLKWAELYYNGGDRDQISLPAAAFLSNFYPNIRESLFLYKLIHVRPNGYVDLSIAGRLKSFLKKDT